MTAKRIFVVRQRTENFTCRYQDSKSICINDVIALICRANDNDDKCPAWNSEKRCRSGCFVVIHNGELRRVNGSDIDFLSYVSS